MANNVTTQINKRKIVYSTAENPVFLGLAKRDNDGKYEKRHLERDGKSVKIVSDGFSDLGKEIQSELKNAGLQNILKLQEMRYGTLENAIARANDRGIYADVSKIPDSVGERAEFVQQAQNSLKQLAAEFGISLEAASKLSGQEIAAMYQKKYATTQTTTTPQNDSSEGGAE